MNDLERQIKLNIKGRLCLISVAVLCALCASVVSCSVPEQKAGQIGDVAGDVQQQIEQVTGLDSLTVGKIAVVVVGYLVAVALFGWLLPNPKCWYYKVTMLAVIVFLTIALPLLLFGGF